MFTLIVRMCKQRWTSWGKSWPELGSLYTISKGAYLISSIREAVLNYDVRVEHKAPNCGSKWIPNVLVQSLWSIRLQAVYSRLFWPSLDVA